MRRRLFVRLNARYTKPNRKQNQNAGLKPGATKIAGQNRSGMSGIKLERPMPPGMNCAGLAEKRLRIAYLSG